MRPFNEAAAICDGIPPMFQFVVLIEFSDLISREYQNQPNVSYGKRQSHVKPIFK